MSLKTPNAPECMLRGVRTYCDLQIVRAVYGQTGRPRGNGSVQALVVPSFVMLIFAVVVPS